MPQTETISPMLSLRDDWVWDSWVVDDDERYHLFFLRAPRALGDPGLRHTAARIGHATSTDLVRWEVVADALAPEAGRWDDLALWTGSVARADDGVWRLFYSGLSTSRGLGVRDQRIGMAESDDLFTWRRADDRPLVVPDPRWYRTDAWRDPFVFKDPAGDGWHMLITARGVGLERRRDGVLGHARSADMVSWELQPPASVAGDALTGPWSLEDARPFRGEPTLCAAPLVRRRDGSWALLGFRNVEPDAPGQLEIVDPIPVGVRDGELIDLI